MLNPVAGPSLFPPLSREQRVLGLLVAQGFCLGLAWAVVAMTANGLFLTAYGAEALPYLYLTNAGALALMSLGFAPLQRRWALRRIVLGVLGVLGGLVLAGRWALAAQAFWLPFALMMLQALQALLSNLLLGIQAGRLLDVRQMKQRFPLVLAAQVLGIVLAGSGIASWQRALGGPVNLLLLPAGALALAWGAAWLIAARFPKAYALVPRNVRLPAPTPRRVFGQRYPRRLFLYQILAALNTELVIILFLTQLHLTFADPAAFTSFLGGLIAVSMSVTLAFLMFFSGRLLNRFGLAYGLAAHPISGLVSMSLLVLAGGWLGLATPVFFWLVMGVRGLTYIFINGVTMPALKTAYQALPPDDQASTQALAEGVGVPVALAIAGASSLLLQRFPGVPLVPLAAYSLVICGLWLGAAVWLYRDYAATLRQTIGKRVLGEADLALDDKSSATIVEALLDSQNPEQVRLALSVLELGEHPALAKRLPALLAHPEANVRADALWHVERRKPDLVPLLATRLALETDPLVLGRVLRALCALTEAEAVEVVRPYLTHPETEVRFGALVGLLRHSGIMGVLTAGEALHQLVLSPHAAERTFAARVIGEVEQPGLYPLLLTLLQAPDADTRKAALLASGQIRHPRLWPALIEQLDASATRSAALAALSASGEGILPLVQKMLQGELPAAPESLARLVRLSGQLRAPAVSTMLRPHWLHPHPAVRQEVLAALYHCGYYLPAREQAELLHALQVETETGWRIVRTQHQLPAGPATEALHAMLDFELAQVRRRVCQRLALAFEPRLILQAADRLEQGLPADKALAFETLEVTLPTAYKQLLWPLLDPTLPLATRADQLRKRFAPEAALPTAADCLHEMLTDARHWPYAWTRVCALYATGHLRATTLTPVITPFTTHPDPVLQETAQWALQQLTRPA